MLSVFCACAMPTEISASAPSAIRLIFMMSLLENAWEQSPRRSRTFLAGSCGYFLNLRRREHLRSAHELRAVRPREVEADVGSVVEALDVPRPREGEDRPAAVIPQAD